ncbi:MAG: hypothetical protein AAFP70_09230, partial [Calditrichota bacterium]
TQYLNEDEAYDPSLTSHSGIINLTGKMPAGFPVEHIYNLPKQISFSNDNTLNLASYPYKQRTRPRTLERVLPSGFFGQAKQKKSSPPTGYYFFLDPDSLIEFDVDRSNNKIQLSPRQKR